MPGYQTDSINNLLRPVDEAPAEDDQHYGPCLLTPGPDDEPWVVGYKDGNEWFTAAGDDGPDRFRPRYFLLLPTL
jgi:hypothetical protein